MKVEIVVTYLPITENLNLTPFQIINRVSSNNAVKAMAESLVERFDEKPENSNFEKVLITLTAKEENIMDITRTYVSRQD